MSFIFIRIQPVHNKNYYTRYKELEPIKFLIRI